jgi:hypothetical protein
MRLTTPRHGQVVAMMSRRATTPQPTDIPSAPFGGLAPGLILGAPDFLPSRRHRVGPSRRWQSPGSNAGGFRDQSRPRAFNRNWHGDGTRWIGSGLRPKAIRLGLNTVDLEAVRLDFASISKHNILSRGNRAQAEVFCAWSSARQPMAGKAGPCLGSNHASVQLWLTPHHLTHGESAGRRDDQ